MNILPFAILVSILGLGWVAFTAQRVLRMDPGNAEMQRIGAAIAAGARAFLFAEYRVLVVFAAVVGLHILIFMTIGWISAHS